MNIALLEKFPAGDTDSKKVTIKHMGGCLEPSIWTATIFKNFLIVPLKDTIFQKFAFTIYEILSIATHCFL
jgi:hypothetical protein